MPKFVQAGTLPFAPSTNRAAALLANLVALGVQDVVVCPGSRSQALAFAAAAAEDVGAVRLHVRVDERSAAFFALGIARETGVPAPVIVTSGSAVANLLPAVWEAHEGRVPMLLLTADRPAELHGRRANQTTGLQPHAFEDAARFMLDFTNPSEFPRRREPEKPAREGAPSLLHLLDSYTPEIALTALAASTGVPLHRLWRQHPEMGNWGDGWRHEHNDELLGEHFEEPRFRELFEQLGGGYREALSGIERCRPLGERYVWEPRFAGPVHLNLPFTEPLSGTGGHGELLPQLFVAAASERQRAEEAGTDFATIRGATTQHSALGQDAQRAAWEPREGDVVIAGDGAGAAAEEFAHASGLPLLAEVVSGARFGRQAISCYAELLAGELGARVRRAFVFGRPTLTRAVWATLAREDLEVLLVGAAHQPGGEQPPVGLLPAEESYLPGKDAYLHPSIRISPEFRPASVRPWLLEWVRADRELTQQRTTVHEPDYQAALETGYKERSAYATVELAAKREPVTRAMLVEAVWRATWPHDRLFLGASRLVRELDRIAPARPVRVHSNRGLGGIDGNIATALGVAVASQAVDDPRAAAGCTRVLLGDLTALHDAGSLLLNPAEPRPRIQVFVGNDAGGGIFEGLEVRERTTPEAFERVLRTPQQADFAALAAAYGWQYTLVTNRGELDACLTAQVTGPQLVEARLGS